MSDLTSDYKHVLTFSNQSSQLNYFMQQVITSTSQNFHADGFVEELVIGLEINLVRQADYLFFTGIDNRTYYYFIDKKEYHSQNSTKLYLTLDVWNTYQHDIVFLPSFVERMHVDRWASTGVPTRELGSEPFTEFDRQVIHQQYTSSNDGVYIFTSTNPLGKLAYRPTASGGGGGHIGGCGDYHLGIPSKNGFLFIKGFEGLAQYAHNIGDGVMTIGYGCTDAYDGQNYQTLKANEPVSDELASTVFATSVTESYGIPLINRLESDGVTVTQNEFDAMLSFVYNAGLGSLTNSAFYQQIKLGNKQQAGQLWLSTNVLPGTQFETGLRERRQAEVNIFLDGNYDIRNTLIYGHGGSISGTLITKDSFVPELITNTCPGGEFVNQLTEDELGNIWQFPVKGTISATFPTYPDGTPHTGIDIAGNDGLAIRSSGYGVVDYIGSDASSGYGYHVVVRMDNGLKHWFGHMKSLPYVTVGQSVTPQTVLGIVGSTGISTGPHVHWEIRTSPYAYDMTCCINPSPSTKLYDNIQGVGD